MEVNPFYNRHRYRNIIFDNYCFRLGFYKAIGSLHILHAIPDAWISRYRFLLGFDGRKVRCMYPIRKSDVHAQHKPVPDTYDFCIQPNGYWAVNLLRKSMNWNEMGLPPLTQRYGTLDWFSIHPCPPSRTCRFFSTVSAQSITYACIRLPLMQ